MKKYWVSSIVILSLLIQPAFAGKEGEVAEEDVPQASLTTLTEEYGQMVVSVADLMREKADLRPLWCESPTLRACACLLVSSTVLLVAAVALGELVKYFDLDAASCAIVFCTAPASWPAIRRIHRSARVVLDQVAAEWVVRRFRSFDVRSAQLLDRNSGTSLALQSRVRELKGADRSALLAAASSIGDVALIRALMDPKQRGHAQLLELLKDSCSICRVNFDSKTGDESDESDERVIDALVVRGCGHLFHRECLGTWYQTRVARPCPVCRDEARPEIFGLSDCLRTQDVPSEEATSLDLPAGDCAGDVSAVEAEAS